PGAAGATAPESSALVMPEEASSKEYRRSCAARALESADRIAIVSTATTYFMSCPSRMFASMKMSSVKIASVKRVLDFERRSPPEKYGDSSGHVLCAARTIRDASTAQRQRRTRRAGRFESRRRTRHKRWLCLTNSEQKAAFPTTPRQRDCAECEQH